MSRLFQTYDEAVEALDIVLQSKTTHNTHNLLGVMQELCKMEWENNEDQQDFAQICSNFDVWVRETGKKSIGRKQFEEWWEVQGTGETGSFSNEALIEAGLKEDPLPRFTAEDAADELGSYFHTVDNSKDAHSLKVENTRLKNENRELRKKVEEFERKFAEIRRMLTWG